MVSMLLFQIIIPCWIESQNPWLSDLEKTNPEDVPYSVVWFGSSFDTSFSRSAAGQTDMSETI